MLSADGQTRSNIPFSTKKSNILIDSSPNLAFAVISIFVAQGCGLPIFLAKVDYLSKESGVFHTFKLTENKEDDINAMQASYESIRGKFPLHQYPPYTGSMPKLSEAETRIIKAMYSFKGVATY